MKITIVVLALIALGWMGHRAFAQTSAAEDYAYLARLHVPRVVVNCVAALDRWVHSAPRYDSVMVPDRRVLKAKVHSGSSIFSIANPIPIDASITMRAFAKLRGEYSWEPVRARCGVRHSEVNAVSLLPPAGEIH
jgi:hypothetical protein